MAAFNRIDTLHLTFDTHTLSVRKPVDKPANIPLTQSKTIPDGVKFNGTIIRICTEMAQQYIFELGEKFKPLVLACEAELRFSARDGVAILNSTDPQFKKMSFSKCSEAQKKTMTPPQTMRLQIWGHNAYTPGGGLTTSSLRIPHMYKHMMETIPAAVRKSDKTSVCIVGPGLDTIDTKMTPCPQAAELLSIFPKAKFLLLDNNTQALEQLNKYRKIQMLPYDAFALRMRLMSTKDIQLINEFAAPKSYINIFNEMAASLGELACHPPNAKAMLVEHKGRLDRVMLKLFSERFAVREFDILTSKYSGPEEQFDVIVATYSIGNAVVRSDDDVVRDDALEILAKFVSALKPGGTLYIDVASYTHIVPLDTDEHERLTKLVNHTLSIGLVDVKDFMPSVDGHMGIIHSFNLHGEQKISTITTSSVVVITKSP